MESPLDRKEVRETLDRAIDFAKKIGIENHDPYDVKGSRIGMWSYGGKSPLRFVVRKGLNALELLFPLALRQAMRIPKIASHGGVARMAQAYTAYGRLTSNDQYQGKAAELLAWLRENHAHAEVGKAWGLPFDWQMFVRVPANSPIGHTTMGVGNALLDFLKVKKEEWMEQDLVAACEFLANGLMQTTRESGSVVLSYTPLDNSEVMNTNAEIAALLANVGRKYERPEFVALSEKVTRFVIETQNEDGSWNYSAPVSGVRKPDIDHYHTGMILAALMSLADNLDGEVRSEVVSALGRGTEFHLRKHFDDLGRPKMRPDSLYPICSYSAGESILTLQEAKESPHLSSGLRERAQARQEALIRFVVRNMMYRDGCFYYRAWKVKKMRVESLRWAQALICHGLAEYLAE